MKKNAAFDAEAFYQALDATREARDLTWREVAKQSGVSASTLTRMAQGKRPDVDGLAALIQWSGLAADDYLSPKKRQNGAKSIAQVASYLRSVPNLKPEAAEMLERLLLSAYRSATKRR